MTTGQLDSGYAWRANGLLPCARLGPMSPSDVLGIVRSRLRSEDACERNGQRPSSMVTLSLPAT